MVDLLLSAPGKNALSLEHMQSITTRVRAANGAPVLVTGDGDAFCAGLNLKEVASLDRAAMATFLDTLEDMVAALYTHPGPTVAAVNGHAIAGGCVLTLVCDHRVITDNPRTRIGLNEVALGLQFPPRLFAMVKQRVPAGSFDRVVLEAALYDPSTALSLGLVDEVAADPIAVGRQRLEALAKHPAEAYAGTKRALRAGALVVSEETRRWFREELVPAWVTPEVKARVLAVLGKGRG